MKRRMLGRVFFLLPVLFFLFAGNMAVQASDKYDYVWMFGFKAGLDFRNSPPTALTSQMDALEGCASVTDRFGNLLFYTDGSKVWNRLHNVMPGGGNLTGMPYLISPTHSTSQGAVIVPVPDQADRYYVFSLSDNAVTPVGNKGKLFYSVVDITLNSGMGDLVSGQTGILLDTGLSEQMTSIPAEKCDVWLFVVTMKHKLRGYRISPAGISPVVESDLLPPTSNEAENFIGKIEVSPNGRLLAFARKTDLSLYDFNRVTGQVSGGGYISSVTSATNPQQSYSVCFSPDNSRLYANEHDIQRGLFQFDLTDPDYAAIAASRVQVGNPIGGGMKRGPDGKIYYCSYDARAIHVINHPNALGTACGFVENVIPLNGGTSASLGFPNIVYMPLLDTVFSACAVTAPCFTEQWRIGSSDTTGWHYLWSNGDTAAYANINASGTYTVQYRKPCAVHIDTVWVTYRWLLPDIMTIPACRVQDNGGSAWLVRRDNEPYQISWQDANGTVLRSGSDTLPDVLPGNYFVRIRNGFGCDTLLPVRIGVEGYLAAFSSDTLVCMNAPVVFLNQSAAYFNSYLWDFGNGDTAQLRNVEYTFTRPGRYRVTLQAAGARCRDTFARYVVVDSQYTEVRFTPDRKEICEGETISFYPDSSNQEVLRLSWQFGDDRESGIPGVAAHYAFSQTGRVPVTLTAEFRVCDPVDYTDTIMVHAYPHFAIVPDSVIPCRPASSLEMEAAPYHEGTYYYLWSTGEISNKITVTDPGMYSVTVKNDFGCSVSRELMVKSGCSMRIPNVFVPNGDGINDYFFNIGALSSGVIRLSLKVFNRWGQMVYHTTRTDGQGWDGTLNGMPQPVGVYVYIMDVVFQDGRQEEYQGNVTLLR